LISEGCIINAKAIKKSVIGNQSRIGEGTVIENSYIMGNDFYQSLTDMKEDIENENQLIGIGERCYINHALVDKNCRIGNDVYINGGKHLTNCSEELYCIKDGIVVIKKGKTLPDNFRIE
jgi:glucose-1-phosphate adenylyltransferase